MADQKKQAAGRKGGRTTMLRHGADHMAKIGSKGGQTTKERYQWLPVGATGYAMVRRSDNQVVSLTGARPW